MKGYTQQSDTVLDVKMIIYTLCKQYIKNSYALDLKHSRNTSEAKILESRIKEYFSYVRSIIDRIAKTSDRSAYARHEAYKTAVYVAHELNFLKFTLKENIIESERQNARLHYNAINTEVMYNKLEGVFSMDMNNLQGKSFFPDNVVICIKQDKNGDVSCTPIHTQIDYKKDGVRTINGVNYVK